MKETWLARQIQHMAFQQALVRISRALRHFYSLSTDSASHAQKHRIFRMAASSETQGQLDPIHDDRSSAVGYLSRSGSAISSYSSHLGIRL